MTLCQYYDQEVRKIGYRSWNHYCAEVKGNGSIEWEKKRLKQEYVKGVKDGSIYREKPRKDGGIKKGEQNV